MTDTLFEKIINREIPADIVYEDDLSLVIKDINPVAPVHLLIIPKKRIEKISDSEVEDKTLLGHLMLVAGKVARDLGIQEAFRLVVNNGKDAGQTVFHLHIHLIAGKEFTELSV
jgi:histidine triad (HIT) family protein|tara:strand:- start:2672 stop:3013 length:342 start_codon:yes stop_codon:yes gene_type:complete